MRISDWSSDVCSSDLLLPHRLLRSHAVTCCLGLHPLSERAHPRIDEPFLAIDQVVALACRHAEIEGIDERPGGDLRVDVAGVAPESSAESRVGKGCVSTGRSRCSTYNKKKKKQKKNKP